MGFLIMVQSPNSKKRHSKYKSPSSWDIHKNEKISEFIIQKLFQVPFPIKNLSKKSQIKYCTIKRNEILNYKFFPIFWLKRYKLVTKKTK